MQISPHLSGDEIARNINEMVDKVCKDLRDFAEYLRQKRCENDTTNNKKEHNTMERREMTASEYAHMRARCCRERAHCDGCPLEEPSRDYEHSCSAFERACPDEAVRLIAEWAEEHPDVLEYVGDGIYYDPKHRIVADEVVRVFTVEITQVGRIEHTEEYLKGVGQEIADEFAAKAYPYNIDNVRCVRAQQFITKCHEEEV